MHGDLMPWELEMEGCGCSRALRTSSSCPLFSPYVPYKGPMDSHNPQALHTAVSPCSVHIWGLFGCPQVPNPCCGTGRGVGGIMGTAWGLSHSEETHSKDTTWPENSFIGWEAVGGQWLWGQLISS